MRGPSDATAERMRQELRKAVVYGMSRPDIYALPPLDENAGIPTGVEP